MNKEFNVEEFVTINLVAESLESYAEHVNQNLIMVRGDLTDCLDAYLFTKTDAGYTLTVVRNNGNIKMLVNNFHDLDLLTKAMELDVIENS